MYHIKLCTSGSDYRTALKVTRDYISWLGIDLTFQKVEDEIKGFEKMYGPPKGCYLLAVDQAGNTAGGAALREFESDICEMKRLYVYQEYLGKGIGEALCRELIKHARAMGYNKMRLDTLGKLTAANKLYDKVGFYEISPYRENPDNTARFMEYLL